MKLIIYKYLGLTASLALNLLYVHRILRGADADGRGPPGAPNGDLSATRVVSKPKTDTSSAASNFQEILQERAVKLREGGLPENDVRAALAPLVNRHYFGLMFAGSSPKDWGKSVPLFAKERRALLREKFGRDAEREELDDQDPFDTTNYQLKFVFTTPEAKERHEFMSSLGGVSVDAAAMATVVDIWKRHKANAAEFLSELNTICDEPTADSIAQSTDERYVRAYRRCLDFSPSLPERRRMAQSWYDVSTTRAAALDRWKAAVISESERTAGMSMVNTQMADLLKEEIGQAAVDSLRMNGW